MRMTNATENMAPAMLSITRRNLTSDQPARAGSEPAGGERFRTAKCRTSGAGKGVIGVNWEILLKKTILYASGHINHWCWRGSPHGVLPCGFDPNSLAAEAISEFLQNPEQARLPVDPIATTAQNPKRLPPA